MAPSMRRASIAAFLLGLAGHFGCCTRGRSPVLEGKIALPGVAGRIDHMAVDLARRAAAGGGTRQRHPRDRGSRGRAPGQASHRAARAAGRGLCAESGSCGRRQRWRWFGAVFPRPGSGAAGSIALGSDADNVRVDPRTGSVIVGYGSGGLAIIDPEKKSKIGDIKLAAHPESFQLDPASGRIFVNVPDAGQIAVVDLAAARQVASWTVPGLRANFPLAARRFRHDDRRGLPPPGQARPARSKDRRSDAAAGHLR